MRGERGLLYVLLLVLAATVLGTGSSMVYANRAARLAEERAIAVAQENARLAAESDRLWCTVLGRLSSTWNDPNSPPQTELGRQVAEDFRDLLAGLGCPPA